MAKHKGRIIPIVLDVVGGETLEEEWLSMEYGEEVRSVKVLKAGVGDHTPERFVDHEPHGNAELQGFAFGPRVMDRETVKRLYALA